MTWSYDADDTIPFPSHNAVNDPATGLHWTSRISCPSRHVLEEYESASGAAAVKLPTKCKAPHNAISRYILKKTHIDVDDDDSIDCDPSSDGGGATTEPATEPMSDNYEALKAMADADNMVRSLSLLPFTLYPHLHLRLWLSKLRRSVVQIY